MIVVFDTNVWISALQFGHDRSVPARAIQKALENDQLAIAPAIFMEICRILTEKFHWQTMDAERIVGSYLRKALHIETCGSVRACRDPNDDMVLECALRARAGAIVSGDKDLLAMDNFEGIPILSAAAYLALGNES